MANPVPVYQTIAAPVTVEQTIEKSRFICDLAPVATEETARDFIAAIRKQHSASRHVCSAFIVGETIPIARSNDDGEPSGTAGRPILSVLEGAGLVNVVSAVTRYFGGILLGTGGLVRAYSGTTSLALESARIVTMQWVFPNSLRVHYAMWGSVQRLFNDHSDIFLDCSQEYLEDVIASFSLKEEDFPKAQKLLEEVLQQTVMLSSTNGYYLTL